jgi:hypothetical protein
LTRLAELGVRAERIGLHWQPILAIVQTVPHG